MYNYYISYKNIIILNRKNNVKIGYLVITGAILSIAVGYSGSTYLLGAFVAGMSFSEVNSNFKYNLEKL